VNFDLPDMLATGPSFVGDSADDISGFDSVLRSDFEEKSLPTFVRPRLRFTSSRLATTPARRRVRNPTRREGGEPGSDQFAALRV